jgi:5'-methylthioadenosine phosphorylase
LKPNETAEIAVIGGSGFYRFLDDDQIEIDTPYGRPSGAISIGKAPSGRAVAFLPRHGPHHELAPHAINYRANIWALKELGVTRIFGPCAAGSLDPSIHPGEFVVSDQLVDRTTGRADTFLEQDSFPIHVSYADPYCPQLREVLIDSARAVGARVHDRGVVMVIQGPRFSTRAESEWYRGAGWQTINMTQYPEAYLARELEICYANISLITDYDAGVKDGEVAPVTAREVMSRFREGNAELRQILIDAVDATPAERHCSCGMALQDARLDPDP